MLSIISAEGVNPPIIKERRACFMDLLDILSALSFTCNLICAVAAIIQLKRDKNKKRAATTSNSDGSDVE